MSARLIVGIIGVGLVSLLARTVMLESPPIDSGERVADVTNPKRIERESFRVSYPGNWKIDTEDEDYDLDEAFAIESPGASSLLLFIFDFATDPVENVQDHAAGFEEMTAQGESTQFTKWGNLEGEGVHIKGTLMDLPAGIKIFSHSTETKSIVVIAQYFEEDLDKVAPGFELIGNSFELIED